MTMDDLTAAVGRGVYGSAQRNAPSTLSIAKDCIAAVQAHLAEHGLLLGPDGLVRAEPCGWGNRIEGRIAVASVRRSKPDYGNYERLFTLIPEEGT